MKSLSSTQYLDQENITYELKEFDTNIEKGVTHIAEYFKIAPRLVLKTLVLSGKSGKTYLCLVESNEKIDLKALRKLLNEKDVTMASPDVILKETGFEVGAIPPFGIKKKLPIYITNSVKDEPLVTVGAGEYGKEIFLSAEALQKATDGTFAQLTKSSPNSNQSTYTIDAKYNLQDVKAVNPPVYLRDIAQFDGKQVELMGWVYNKRSSGGIYFLQLRDGTGFIQIVAEKKTIGEKNFTLCDDVTIESSIRIKGTVRKDERAPSGYEIDLIEISLIQLAPEYPIQKKEHGIEFLLDNRHLWLRSSKQWAIQRIRNTIINAIYEHLNSEGFIKIDSPILTPNACEGTTTLFPVPYLPSWKDEDQKGSPLMVNIPGNKEQPVVYLSQSGQLYLEAAIMAHGKVFDFGPTFRAEKSKTRRHLTEFWMMDAEAAFTDHIGNIQTQEKLTVAIVQKVLKENLKELEILGRDIDKLAPSAEGKYPVITHAEAVKRVQKMGSAIKDRDDLGAEDETLLTKEFDRPFFVERYPKEVKAFYMKEDPDDPTRVLNDDMLAPEGYGEVIGGSQREDDYEKLLTRILKENLSVKDFEWYLDLRKYGSVPHSGFGIGLERYVAWICGLKHIRQTIPFPRTIYRLKP